MNTYVYFRIAPTPHYGFLVSTRVCWICLLLIFFLAFDFCRFCVIIRLFHPRHNGQWPPTSKGFHPRSYPLHFLSYLYSSKRASISLFNVECQRREQVVPILKRLWYDAVLDWGLNPEPPVLEASTLPLGYRCGWICLLICLCISRMFALI